MNNFSKIGVFAPSSYVEKADIDASRVALEAHGYEVFVHPQTYARDNQSAGTVAEKLEALHSLYADPTIHAIWAAGGGNRALHILEGLDIDLIKANPKPMIGFSDVTALLNVITARTGIVNYHAPVFKHLHQEGVIARFLSSDFPLDKAEILNAGKAEGRLFGGNLSVFQYLSADIPDGAIIFLEDCNEELSRIDRMLLHLRRSGVFERAAGIVFGEFMDLADSARPFGFTIEDILREHTDGLDIPVVMNAPFGHGGNNYALPIGQSAALDTDGKILSF